MADITVEPVGSQERGILIEWLDSAAIENIDVTQIETIDAAYEGYVEHVSNQAPDERDDPSAHVAMIGFALGQWLNNNTVLEWRVITEDGQRDLGLSLPDETAIIFPTDRVAQAWNSRERRWLAPWARELRAQLEGLA